MRVFKKFRNYLHPTLISLLIFILLAAGISAFTNYKLGLWEKDIRAGLFDVVSGKKSKLEKALYSRIFYTRGVAAYVSLNPEISQDEFAELAKEYIKNDTVIGTMSLSKDCIITDIYPVEGHEEAIGLNLLEHPERKKIVEKTIETHLTFIAGPVELVEGGTAFISYTPVFDKTTSGQERFWGVTDIVIKQDELLNEADLNTTENGFKYALRGVNGDGYDGDVFWGDPAIFDQNPVTISVDLPIGKWILAAAPVSGWRKYADQDKTMFLVLLFSAIIISILIWLFVNALAKIRRNEKELKAIFASLDSLIIELDSKGKYLKIAAINEVDLILPREELIGKYIHELFDQEEAEYIMQAIKKCLKSKELQIVEYRLVLRGKEKWFSARISYKGHNSIIFNANDITKAKEREKQLQESEQQLKELNASKDKFFSIIAHDLRSPLAGQKGVIDILMAEHDQLDEPTKRDLLKSVQTSANQLYVLLENLLKWVLSQSGGIKPVFSKIDFKSTYGVVFHRFETSARLKDIRLEDNLEEGIDITADEQLTDTVLRNLVSNAIKFTHKGGKVSVQSEVVTRNGRSFCKVSVADTGIGIAPDALARLFVTGNTMFSNGTANEKGSGLGLLLCKEFVEIQGGEIWAESTVDNGSVFSFTLPVAE
ncbi:PAS domain S-box protein [Maribellus luteus]|uniref:histidine kinase n=1 Tax=Maribellus luteus TaxID=2305463 RepID=A0A399SXI8_9BACT|nr:ATP-binding protein [Maribellus luteus]RIJ48208.1 PAS domain S-box protein [Maribellus luteus]